MMDSRMKHAGMTNWKKSRVNPITPESDYDFREYSRIINNRFLCEVMK